MNFRKFLLISLSSLILSQNAYGARCNTQYSGDALGLLFSGIRHWAEVRSKDSYKMATNKPVEFNVSFTDYKKSEVYVSGKLTGRFLGICRLGKKSVTVRARQKGIKVNIAITKLEEKEGKELLRSEFSILGFHEVYFYRPASQVKMN